MIQQLLFWRYCNTNNEHLLLHEFINIITNQKYWFLTYNNTMSFYKLVLSRTSQVPGFTWFKRILSRLEMKSLITISNPHTHTHILFNSELGDHYLDLRIFKIVNTEPGIKDNCYSLMILNHGFRNIYYLYFRIF